MSKTSLGCKCLHKQGPVYEPTFHVTNFLSLSPKPAVLRKGSHLHTTLPYNSSSYSFILYYLSVIRWWKFVEIMLGNNYRVLRPNMSKFKIYRIFNEYSLRGPLAFKSDLYWLAYFSWWVSVQHGFSVIFVYLLFGSLWNDWLEICSLG